MKTIAFDRYGTLIDLSGAAPIVAKYMKTGLAQFLPMFGNKQVKFYFRRALMKKTVPHPTLTRDALDYCLDKTHRHKDRMYYKRNNVYIHYLKCFCPLHNENGMKSHNLCDCSRKSMEYKMNAVFGENRATVELINSRIRG